MRCHPEARAVCAPQDLCNPNPAAHYCVKSVTTAKPNGEPICALGAMERFAALLSYI